ncbi:MAG: EAL domain-containing protein [Gammaproteobacteria bacterium]|nr:EAL domain-containing protein [Gammaproteobacteria bacterium]
MLEAVRNHYGTSRLILLFGFGTMLLLCVAMGLIGLGESNYSHEKLENIVSTTSVKSNLIIKMHTAARERSIMLYGVVTEEDPFVRDDALTRFNYFAAEFSLAYNELLAMDLSPQEKTLLQQQAEAAKIAVPLLDRVIDLAWQGHLKAAQILLATRALEAQNKVLNLLSQLQNIQLESIQQIEQLADESNRHAHTIIVLFLSLALFIGAAVTYRIIGRVSLSEKNLEVEKKLAQITLQSIGDAAITTDKTGNIQFINPIAEQLTGFTMHEAIGKKLEDILNLMDETTHKQARNPVMTALNTHTILSVTENIILICKDKTEFAIELTAAPIMDDRKSLYGAVLIFRDVSEMRSMSYKLAYQATHDSLTGLVNRYEFENRLNMAITTSRNNKIQHALCYMDLDQFKTVNDSAGHAAGDELLKQIANKLSPLLRKSDVLARLGGDEFGVLLENCSENQAHILAESMRAAIKDTRFPWGNNTYEIGVSIGLVPINNESGSLTDILSAADTACYTAKDNGRNQIQVYCKDNIEFNKHKTEMLWFQDINKALDNNTFSLFCQHIIPLNNGTGHQHFSELLIRFNKSNGETIPPMAFLPAAERYNLMQDIDKWVVHNALQILVNNRSNNTMRLSVNLSGQSLSDSSFHQYVHDEIINSHCEPDNLCFEITETTAIANMSQAIHFIKSLKELGCKFALDDFGNGLSSFAYLKNMPVDYIKIDGSFVRDICHDQMDRAFIEAIHRIGKMMHISTIAEYVESECILNKLNEIGIDYAQGFFFNEPSDIKHMTGIFKQKQGTSNQHRGPHI